MVDLVGQLYDAALDDGLWSGLSARIADAFDSSSTVLKLHGADDHVHLLETTSNMIVPDRLQDWAADWHSKDLWVHRSVSFGMSRIVTSQDLVSEGEQRASGFYQEWLRQLDIWHMIGAVFPTDDAAIGVLGIHRPQDAAGYSDRDRRRLALLLPHLQRALRLGQRMAQTSLAHDVTLESLDALDTGVMIVDKSGHILHANAVAEEMLGDSAELSVRDGRLAAPAPAVRGRITAAIHGAVAIAEGRLEAAAAAIRIDRPPRTAWTMTVSPLRPRWTRLAWQRPLALILMRDPEYPPFLIDRLRELFGLTRTEALTAAELARGHALPEIGETLGVGIGTVRTHLKQILLKTETNRQAEAVAAICRSVAAIRAS